eukprot:g62860.t1
MTECWREDPETRPTMEEVNQTIMATLQSISDPSGPPDPLRQPSEFATSGQMKKNPSLKDGTTRTGRADGHNNLPAFGRFFSDSVNIH